MSDFEGDLRILRGKCQLQMKFVRCQLKKVKISKKELLKFSQKAQQFHQTSLESFQKQKNWWKSFRDKTWVKKRSLTQFTTVSSERRGWNSEDVTIQRRAFVSVISPIQVAWKEAPEIHSWRVQEQALKTHSMSPCRGSNCQSQEIARDFHH